MTCLSFVLWSISGLISVMYLFFKTRFAYWKKRGVPYLEPTFPLGTVSLKRRPMIERFNKFYTAKENHLFVGGFIFASPVLVATHLDFIKNIMVKDFSSFNERGVYVNEEDDPLSGHMFAVAGEKWKMLRSKLSPTFTSGKMKFMCPTVVKVAEQFDAVLGEIVGKSGKELEIKDLLARFTTDVIGTCAFGIECNSLKNPNSEFRRYGQKVFEDPHLGNFGQLFVLLFQGLARKLHVQMFSTGVINFFMQTVRETIDYREKNNIRRNDFMDLLIRLKNGQSVDDDNSKIVEKLSFEELAAQAFVFFLAGFETSSTTMMFSLYALALNPDIQEKAREEIETVLSNHNGKLTYEAIKDMVYVDRIVSETLRKYPPIAQLIRKCTRTYEVPDTEVIIEKGTVIMIPVYSIHHDPEIYPEPEIFDPDRFTPEQIKSRHPSAFLGFGDGPRNCIGLRFGRMQSRIGLITLLRNYRFKVSPKTPVPMIFSKVNGILSPEDGMHLHVEKI